MRKIFYFLVLGMVLPAGYLFAQGILPAITVKNLKGKVVISWKNEYPIKVKTINVQRSYDSTKNFTTIGSVPNPLKVENGFVDAKPPYDKMFYRVFIFFDGGEYIFSESHRPGSELSTTQVQLTDSLGQAVVADDPFNKADGIKIQEQDKNKGAVVTKPAVAVVVPKEEVINYPSRRIYTGKDNNIVINLPDFASHNYTVKFYDEDNKFLFELNKITEPWLIIEKVNFLRAGWFFFDLYDNGKLIEKNKVLIPK